ncbi:MAG: transporter substrate-binding domain-containing protein [Coriobacteriales bacterium]|nr:transporter substrate-binding domain-containing protein [Coriobacteriales bacterium]
MSTISRRHFIAGLALAAVAAPMALNSLSFADEKSAEFKLEGKFVLGFDQDFPPYGYIGNDGSFTGFDIDLATELCKRLGWELELVPIAWDSKDALLNSGQITCIWNGFTIEGREDGYEFTDAYMENRQVIAVRANSGIEKLEDLAGKIVLTQADSAALELLSEGGDHEDLAKTFADLQTIDNYNTAFMMLEMSQVDAIAVDAPVAAFNIGDKTDVFKVLDEALNSEHYGVGFKKGETELAAAVQAELIAMDEDGFVKELCEKYADQGVSYDAWVLGKEAAGGYKDGVYEATGKGIGGKVPLTVTIEGGKIVSVEVGANGETMGIGSKAIEKLPALIVEAQGIEGVDGVSGASVTSKAIFTAMADILEQAKA